MIRCRCLLCEGKIGWLRMLHDKSFCRDDHERLYWESWQKRALDRLWGRAQTDSQEASPQPNCPTTAYPVHLNEKSARETALAALIIGLFFMVVLAASGFALSLRLQRPASGAGFAASGRQNRASP